MTAAILLRVLDTVKRKDGGLLLIAIPPVPSVLPPAPDDRFVNVLPVRAREHEAVFLPHESRANFKARIFISVMKDAGFCRCVEYVDGSICCHRGVERREGTLEKFVGVFVIQIVVLDFPRRAFETDHVRRVRADEIDLFATEQSLVAFEFRRIAAEDAMLSEMPKVAQLSDTRFLQFGIHIKIVLLRFVVR